VVLVCLIVAQVMKVLAVVTVAQVMKVLAVVTLLVALLGYALYFYGSSLLRSV
jgi:hypothetical protein